MVSGGEMLQIDIDGSRRLEAGTVEAVNGFSDRAEDATDPGPAVVRVTGAPAAGLPAGLDIGLITKWERALRRLERLPRLTVAVATGEVGGTALEAFLAADVRIVTPDAVLQVGDWPGMAVYRLVQLAGAAAVRRTVLGGRQVDADEAVRTGIADAVTDDPKAAVAEAAALPGTLAGPEARIRRQLMFEATTTSFEEALGAHLAACDRLLRSPAGAAS
jgi:isomerase DpgB